MVSIEKVLITSLILGAETAISSKNPMIDNILKSRLSKSSSGDFSQKYAYGQCHSKAHLKTSGGGGGSHSRTFTCLNENIASEDSEYIESLLS